LLCDTGFEPKYRDSTFARCRSFTIQVPAKGLPQGGRKNDYSSAFRSFVRVGDRIVDIGCSGCSVCEWDWTGQGRREHR
jgi:hypothetical protein